MMASIRPDEGVPNIVMVGVPDVKALNRVRDKMAKHQIPHYAWVEPDNDLGFTSITTAPLREDKRQFLRNYRVYNTPVVQGQDIQPLKLEMEDTALPGSAKAPVAQLREHLIFNQEAGSENLPGGSI